jgi:hypothetical protein
MSDMVITKENGLLCTGHDKNLSFPCWKKDVGGANVFSFAPARTTTSPPR